MRALSDSAAGLDVHHTGNAPAAHHVSPGDGTTRFLMRAQFLGGTVQPLASSGITGAPRPRLFGAPSPSSARVVAAELVCSSALLFRRLGVGHQRRGVSVPGARDAIPCGEGILTDTDRADAMGAADDARSSASRRSREVSWFTHHNTQGSPAPPGHAAPNDRMRDGLRPACGARQLRVFRPPTPRLSGARAPAWASAAL